MSETPMTRCAKDIAEALNRACAENESNTPDFILAAYLIKALEAFDLAVRQRERWYGRSPNDGPGQLAHQTRDEAVRLVSVVAKASEEWSTHAEEPAEYRAIARLREAVRGLSAMFPASEPQP